jgi:hypothetical protein
VQDNAMLRRAEPPSLLLQRSKGQTTSLTHTWTESSGLAVYLGFARQRHLRPVAQDNSELFVKVQFDLERARTLLRTR